MQATNTLKFLLFALRGARFRLPAPQRADAGRAGYAGCPLGFGAHAVRGQEAAALRRAPGRCCCAIGLRRGATRRGGTRPPRAGAEPRGQGRPAGAQGTGWLWEARRPGQQRPRPGPCAPAWPRARLCSAAARGSCWPRAPRCRRGGRGLVARGQPARGLRAPRGATADGEALGDVRPAEDAEAVAGRETRLLWPPSRPRGPGLSLRGAVSVRRRAQPPGQRPSAPWTARRGRGRSRACWPGPGPGPR